MGSTVSIDGKKLARGDGDRSWAAGRQIDKGGQGRVYLAREVGRGSEDALGSLVQALRDAASTVHASRDQLQDSELAFGAALRRFVAEGEGYEFALKLYQEREDQDHASLLARFRAEVAALRKVSHPGVVRVEDAGSLEDGRPFVVYPYFRRGNLKAHRANYVGQALASLGAIAEVLEAIKQLHISSLVHRDLKPENILLSEAGSLIVADLGLVLDQKREAALTHVGEHVGNWEFGPDWGYSDLEHERDPRRDLYALAKILWWLASGKPHLPREKWSDKTFNLALQFPDEAGMRDVNRVLNNGLAGSPDEMRYASASDMLADVRSAIEEVQSKRHAARGAPHGCRACQAGKYARVQGVPFQGLEQWRVNSNLHSVGIVGIDLYRCDACGHLVLYATHPEPKK